MESQSLKRARKRASSKADLVLELRKLGHSAVEAHEIANGTKE